MTICSIVVYAQLAVEFEEADAHAKYVAGLDAAWVIGGYTSFCRGTK